MNGGQKETCFTSSFGGQLCESRSSGWEHATRGQASPTEEVHTVSQFLSSLRQALSIHHPVNCAASLKAGNIRIEITILVCLTLLSASVPAIQVHAVAVQPPAVSISLSGLATEPGTDEVLDVQMTIKGYTAYTTGANTLELTGGLLTVGGIPWQCEYGTGNLNQRSLTVVLYATCASGDNTGHLILIGHADNSLPGPGTITVTFPSPKSKIVEIFEVGKGSHPYLLDISGTLTIS